MSKFIDIRPVELICCQVQEGRQMGGKRNLVNLGHLLQFCEHSTNKRLSTLSGGRKFLSVRFSVNLLNQTMRK